MQQTQVADMGVYERLGKQGAHHSKVPSPRLRGHIESAVAQVFGVAHRDLGLPTRGRKRVALARQAAMYLAHVACGLTFKDVGTLFGRDRTTVSHACEVIEDLRDDANFDRVMQLLEWIVGALLLPRHSLITI